MYFQALCTGILIAVAIANPTPLFISMAAAAVLFDIFFVMSE